MVFVKVSIHVQGRDVPAEQVKDKSVAAALQKMGQDIGRKLTGIVCPEHAKPPTNVRVHVGKSGDGDLAYESCCPKLKDAISAVLG